MTADSDQASAAGKGDAWAPDFMDKLDKAKVRGLWGQYDNIVSVEPIAPDDPIHWAWKELQPLAERAARDVTIADAERRVLMLINPDFGTGITTTTNLFAGIQIMNPGDHAPLHWHTASALRFVMEGSGGATIVNGKRCDMEKGDLILTPNKTWHEHINEGNEKVIWFDGLDLPLTGGLGVFSGRGNPEEFPADTSTLSDASFAFGGMVPDTGREQTSYSPLFRYPWTTTLEALAVLPAAKDGSKRLRYTNPMTGGPVIPTLDSFVWELAAGSDTQAYRTTSNAIYLVVEGEGTSQVGEKTFEWQTNHVFTAPHWNWVSHRAAGGTARLFMLTDRAMLRDIDQLTDEVKD